jgi:hypothetical protein
MPIRFWEPVRKCLVCGAAIVVIGAGIAHACAGDACSKALLDLTEAAAKAMQAGTSATSSISSSVEFTVGGPAKARYAGFYKSVQPDQGAQGTLPAEWPKRTT